VVSVAGTSVAEGAAGSSGRALFAVTLSQASATPVTVSYATANGTATAGSDYTAATGTVTFPAGSTRQEVAVAVSGDAQVESDETFTLMLTAPQNATLGQATATGRIVNDDVAPPPDPGTLPIARHDRVLAAYFPEWVIYGRNFQVADVPAEKLTHLSYSFLDLKSDGNVALFDSYAAVEKRFPAGETVSGEADLWYYAPGDPRATQTVWGNFNQLAQLKEKYPHLRVSIAVGGWTLSDLFSTVCSTATGRETFAASLLKFLETYRMFDGIDFDWEYPGGSARGATRRARPTGGTTPCCWRRSAPSSTASRPAPGGATRSRSRRRRGSTRSRTSTPPVWRRRSRFSTS
jgi:hypothetical protein